MDWLGRKAAGIAQEEKKKKRKAAGPGPGITGQFHLFQKCKIPKITAKSTI
jgi:hypothetical protein